jgi:sugar transferase (PEP-CTERM/EpsH1 system associated)
MGDISAIDNEALRPARSSTLDRRPLIAHILFSLDYGGLENGVVNLVNGMAPERFRHAIIALTHASEFRHRLRREDAGVYVINKRPGKDPRAYIRLFRLLRALRPTVVHTRNFGTLDCALVAGLAGVPWRIHGEHGWDVHDPDGTRSKYRRIRRLLNPMIDRFIVVSRDLEQWISGRVGIDASKIVRICNGVDTNRFRPASGESRQILPPEWRASRAVVVGSVLRFSEIKDPLNLVRAFIEARTTLIGQAMRLLLVGDGVLRVKAVELLSEAGVLDYAWLTGSRDDIPDLLRAMDVFVLGSRREGISNTLLEAMATGLPVIATATGGNLELVRDRISGRLVPPGDAPALAGAMLEYVQNAELRAAHGSAARSLAERQYSLQTMIRDYGHLYDRYLLRPEESA